MKLISGKGINGPTEQGVFLKLPAKYNNLLFGAMLSVIMVTIISGAVVLVNQGLTVNLPEQWLKGFATAWPIAFPSVLVIAPRVRKLVDRLTGTIV